MSTTRRVQSADQQCETNLSLGRQAFEAKGDGARETSQPTGPGAKPPRLKEQERVPPLNELELEEQLGCVSRLLLSRYSATEDWLAVSQLALSLATNRDRIDRLGQTASQLYCPLEDHPAPPSQLATPTGASDAVMVDVSVASPNLVEAEEGCVGCGGDCGATLTEQSVASSYLNGIGGEVEEEEEVMVNVKEEKKEEEEEEKKEEEEEEDEREEEEDEREQAVEGVGHQNSMVSPPCREASDHTFCVVKKSTPESAHADCYRVSVGESEENAVSLTPEEFHRLVRYLHSEFDIPELQELCASLPESVSSENGTEEEEEADECQRLATVMNQALQSTQLQKNALEGFLQWATSVASVVAKHDDPALVPATASLSDDRVVTPEAHPQVLQLASSEIGAPESVFELSSPVSVDRVSCVSPSSSSDETGGEGAVDIWPQKTNSTPALTEGLEVLEEEGEGQMDDFPARTVSSEDIAAEGRPTGGRVKRERSLPSIFTLSLGSGRGLRGSFSIVKRKLVNVRRRAPTTLDGASPTFVRLAHSIPTTEWDPTCLLEELYTDHKQLSVQNCPAGETARHYGYLEKLPVNQAKKTVRKGWKRRYFRVMEGNIFYYEDRTSTPALGFCRLQNAKIVCKPVKSKIEVRESNGRFVVLRAHSMPEMNEWHRALQLEAAHPTMGPALSPTPKRDNPVLIIDIGACSVRAGFADDNPYPEVFAPAVCSMDLHSFELIDCGHQALLPQNRYDARLLYPRRPATRMDRLNWQEVNARLALQSVVEMVLETLNVDAQSCILVMTAPMTEGLDREKLVDMLLGSIGFAGVYLQEQALLALYSYNTTSGVIVDVGDHIDIVPVIDGYTIEAGVQRMPFGGNAITDSLKKLITEKSIRYFSETESYINRFIKESLCFVSQDYDGDSGQCEENTINFTRAVEMERFQLPDHRKVIALDDALFRATEGLFSPGLWGKDVPGIHELVWKAIQACPIDQRKEMSRKIFLSGGTSLLSGLPERLHKELGSLAPPGAVIEVHASDSRQHAAYMGAAVLAGLGTFREMVVTQEEWSSLGADALHKWTVS